jgi:hypothetical protein
MSSRTSNRLLAISGVAFVVLQFVGTVLSMAAGKTHGLTISSSATAITRAIAHPVGTAVWAGAYLEMLSVCFFLAFAVFLAERLGGGPLGSLIKLAAAATAGGGVVALAIINVISYRAGHGMSADVAKTLVVTGEAVYVATWFFNATLLAAAASLALRSGHRVIGWSAVAIVAYTLVFTPLAVDNAGQFSQLLFLLWVIATSIALARPRRAAAHAAAVVQPA